LTPAWTTPEHAPEVRATEDPNSVPHQDAFLPAFASPVFTRQFHGNEALHARLLEVVRRLAQSSRSDEHYRAHHGGFYTPGSLFDDCAPPSTEVRELFRAAPRPDVCQVASSGHGHTQATPDHWIQLQGWAALTRAGDYQPPHAHAGSNSSCIYDVAVPAKPEPQDTLDLLNPLEPAGAAGDDLHSGWQHHCARHSASIEAQLCQRSRDGSSNAHALRLG
jgi:hypothetical protein